MDKDIVITQAKKDISFVSNKTSKPLAKEVLSGDKKFLAIIAHDIKTPMGSIIGFLNLITVRMHNWDKDEILEHIEIALLSAKRTYSLLNNLLEWANSENIFKSFNPEIIDLDNILKEEIADIEIFTVQKQIKINSLVFPAVKVFADKKMLKSILRNLLANAVKYSHKSGKIDITSKRGKDFLEITIKDYGVGINSETASSIFSSNNYISTLGTDNEPGTGYGLLLCKELVEINKGKIWIVGKADRGSEFKFTLPLIS